MHKIAEYREQPMRIVVNIMLLSFPAAANLIPHANSVILLILVLTGLSVGLRLSKFQMNRPEKLVMWSSVAFALVYIFAFIFHGLFGNAQELRLKLIEHELRWLALLPVYAAVRYSKASSKVLWAGCLSGAIIAGIYAIVMIFWLEPGGRVSGSYHAIAFGDLSLICAFLSILSTGWLIKKEGPLKLLPWFAFLLGLIASIASGTRGAWIAIPALLILSYLYLGTLFEKADRISIGIVSCLILLGAYYMPPTQVQERFSQMIEEVLDYSSNNEEYTSTSTRIAGWQAALEIYAGNPIIGVGPGQYGRHLKALVTEGRSYQVATRHKQPHNIYLLVMVECGTVGLVALLALFWTPIWSGIGMLRTKPIRELGFGLIFLGVGFVHFGLTETIFGRNVFTSFYIVMTASMLAIAANRNEGGDNGRLH
jgi:O-antigen ligase